MTAADTEVSLTGLLVIIRGDPPDPGGEPVMRYVLADEQGNTTRLLLNSELVTRLGGPLALDGKRVTIVGVTVSTPPGAVRVLSMDVGRKDGRGR